MTAAVSASFDIAELNALSEARFVAALGSAFEHAAWVARAAWKARPFADVDALHAAMLDAVRASPRERQLVFLCGHPELAGREAQQSTMTADSVSEQASAGLDAMSRAEMEQMQALNRAYRQRHGFPFIIAVRRYNKAQIFAEMRRRLQADTENEFAAALVQIGIITRLRLDALVKSA